MASLNLYKGNYKRMFIPVAILYLVFAYIIFVSPGITKGIDLVGGTLVIVRSDAPIDADKLTSILAKDYSLAQLQVTSISSPTGGHGATIQFASNPDLQKAAEEVSAARQALKSGPEQAVVHAKASLALTAKYVETPAKEGKDAQDYVELASQQLIAADEAFHNGLQDTIVKEFGLGENAKFQKKEVGASLGQAFWDSALFATLLAFAAVSIVIFVSFRELVPALAVILAAAFDILCALAFMAFFRIPLDLASIPSLLMLIGYSVDTDIMLTSRMLTRKEVEPRERAMEAFWTGMTMTTTTVVALVVMLISSYFGQIMTFFQIAAVLLFGLIGDIISTWLMNAPILLWYVEEMKPRAGVRRR